MLFSGDLKNKTVAMAAIAGLAYAGASGAAIVTGSSEGELFLNLINTTAGVSATFDLGVPIQSFSVDALGPAGIRLQWDLSGTAAWSSFVGAAGASLGSSKFDIKALGPSNAFAGDVVYLTTVSSGVPANQDFSQLQNFQQVDAFVQVTNGAATHSTQSNGADFAIAANPSLYHETAVGDSWMNFLNGTSTGAIGSDLTFYQLSGNFFDGLVNVSPYGGAWNLSEAGMLSYATAPIPEPGSWAMLLAGLTALGAIARRRLAPRGGDSLG